MRRYILEILALVLSFGIIFLVLLHSATPVLYSPEYDAFTEKHTNPAALEPLGQDRAGKLIPLMSDLLDAPGSLILNIQYGDLDIARHDLEEFRELSRSMDALVINLDMSSSDVEDFSRMNRNNLLILSELINSTARLEELKTLEIRFRDEDDPATMTSITYEGESLRNRVTQLYNEYKSQEEPMVSVSNNLELDTTGYMESQENFREITSRIENEQEERLYFFQTQVVPDRNPYHISLSLIPREAAFHDTVRIKGSLSGMQIDSREIELFIDTEKTGSVITDSKGNWEYRFLIEAIEPGRHTAFAVFSNSTFSDIVPFDVMYLNSFIVLEEPELTENGLICIGSLSTDKGPVDGVCVDILVDGKKTASPVTGNTGNFEVLIRPSPGEHRIQAVFSNPDLPLSMSGSSIFTVIIPSSGLADPGSFLRWENILALVLAGAVIIGTAVGGYAYVHRTRPSMRRLLPHRPPDDEPASSVLTQADINKQMPSPSIRRDNEIEDVFEEYLNMTDTNIRGAVHVLFSHLREEIGRILSLRNPCSLTPREICKKTSDLLIFRDFSAFIRQYELIRYGLGSPDDHEKNSIAVLFRTISMAIKGGKHH